LHEYFPFPLVIRNTVLYITQKQRAIMKKLNVFIAGALLLLTSLGASAQSKTGADYFAGKWSVLVKGTPNGDARLFVSLEKKDSIMTGAIQDSTGTEMAKINKVELTDTTVKVYFTAQGYDVYLLLTKRSDDHAAGDMLGMFEADGDRIKKIK
jgi:hypothetical protein